MADPRRASLLVLRAPKGFCRSCLAKIHPGHAADPAYHWPDCQFVIMPARVVSMLDEVLGDS